MLLIVLNLIIHLYFIDIPDELEGYLRFVARTGDTVFKWPMIQYLYREKMRSVIQNFYETTASIADLPHYPNVDPFYFEAMKKMLIERMDNFHAAPFTVQRLSELLTEPRKQYSRIDKFMRAIEKNVLVVSPAESQRKRHESENGESLDSTLSMNGDICSDLDIGVENDHGPLNLHESKPDDLAKIDGTDPLDDDVPLDKLEPEVNVFTPEGDLETVPEIDTKIDVVPNGSSTPEPATTSTVSEADDSEAVTQEAQVESTNDKPEPIVLQEKEKAEEVAAPLESNLVVTTETATPNPTKIAEEAAPGKRVLEDDNETTTISATSTDEPSIDPSPSKKQKVDEEEPELSVPVESTLEPKSDAVDTLTVTEPVVDVKPAEPTPETTSPSQVSAIEPVNPEVEPSELVLDTIPTATEPTTADPVIEQYEAPLIDISLTTDSTAALIADAPTEDLISMIEVPIMEQIQSSVTNPPIDPIRLPSIDSIIPEAVSVGLVAQIDQTQSMEIAKVDDDLMKVDLPGTTTPVQEAISVAVESKMQTDDDEAPATSEMDVDESSADFMDQ